MSIASTWASPSLLSEPSCTAGEPLSRIRAARGAKKKASGNRRTPSNNSKSNTLAESGGTDKLTHVRCEARVRTNLNTAGLIAEQSPQVLRAIGSCAAMIVDHVANPIRRRRLLKHVLNSLPLSSGIGISHAKNHRERCRHRAFCDGPI